MLALFKSDVGSAIQTLAIACQETDFRGTTLEHVRVSRWIKVSGSITEVIKGISIPITLSI